MNGSFLFEKRQDFPGCETGYLAPDASYRHLLVEGSVFTEVLFNSVPAPKRVS